MKHSIYQLCFKYQLLVLHRFRPILSYSMLEKLNLKLPCIYIELFHDVGELYFNVSCRLHQRVIISSVVQEDGRSDQSNQIKSDQT